MAESEGYDELYSMPGHLVRRLWQVHTALFTSEFAALDLTSVQYAALRALRSNPEIGATQLSELIAFDRSTLGGVLYRLELKGLIARRSTEEDRRIKIVTLTPAGTKILKKTELAVKRVQARMLQPLNEKDRREFIRLLKVLTDSTGG